ncbi:MAG TPA: hypothetical protein VFD58_01370 [Blastocatellia bacterium]|nr:hypothetical protein [Blastocatellia bacterium]
MYSYHPCKEFSCRRKSVWETTLPSILLALALLIIPVAAQAQSATIVGYLSNFDAVNNTGQDVHGLEIQLEGLSPADIYYTFSVNRYGAPTVVPYATGVYVRWMSPFDSSAQQFTATTVPHAPNTAFGGTCYQWQFNYATCGCEHFGVTLRANALATTYRWLVADPQTPGALTTYGTPVAIPGPVWVIAPPAQPEAPPVVVAEIAAPEAPNPELQWGDAQWVKVFKTEMPREVGLDELVGDNPVVPQDPGHVETAWKLIQNSPPTSQKQKGRLANQGQLGGGSQSVIRRYEFYAYTGAYNPVTHEAMCGGDGSCNAPLDGELGDAIGAQMAAANIAVPSITVTTAGNGSVSSADKVISCGNKCSAVYPLGTVVTMVASPASGYVFTGWGGACTGAQATCSVAVNDALNVTATFTPQFTLSIGRGGSGTVTSAPAGIDCGKNCSAKFAQGTTVTLNATPAAGLRFINWTGDCSGTTPTCNVTITRSTSVQANFAK